MREIQTLEITLGDDDIVKDHMHSYVGGYFLQKLPSNAGFNQPVKLNALGVHWIFNSPDGESYL